MTGARSIGDIVSENVALGPMTTYKAGGAAKLFAELATREDLDELITTGLTSENRVLIVGRGSNLVVSDDGFDGLAIRLTGDFTAVEVEGTRVVAGGAAPLPRLARTAVEASVLGLEFFVGVPGSVGGAVRQNAGCFGVETADVLHIATIVDIATGEVRESGVEDLDLGYRHSNVGQRDLVASATFRGVVGDIATGKEKMKEITRWRRDHQPGGTLNAGSVFKNPPGTAAGRLIDDLGLKGTRVGDVAVSEKHANFFVAGPDATARDIYELMTLVKDTVFERSGTMLEPEIQFVGFEE